MKSYAGEEQSSETAGGALEPVNKMMRYIEKNDKLHVAWCVAGIFGCMLLYGSLQVCSKVSSVSE